MAHLTWLHLSDWHQRGSDFDRKVVRDKLIEDLRTRESIDPRLATIDFIIFSGDIAFCGLPAEYAAARVNLFDPVLQATNLTPDRLFMVPGNHDVDRNIVEEMLPPELNQPLESDQLVNKWLTEPKKLHRVLEPFEAYSDFVEQYTGQPQPAYASINRLTKDGVDVAILGLNSAWMCGRSKDAGGEVNDYGFLVVGEPQIHDGLKEIVDATVRIAVLHHPFRWLKGFEQNKIESRLKKSCHFILHGHEHESGADSTKGISGDSMMIPGGASYDRRNADNARYTNAYNFVHLDTATGEGVVFFRRWSEKRTAWIADTDTYAEGKFPFALPKQITGSFAATSTSSNSVVTDNAALEADYRRQTIETFKDLSFKGLTASVRPILLPLEKVYVQLRAVAEVPEAADEFTPEERKVLRWIEEDRKGHERERPEDLREAELRLDALRRERWTKDRLERFPIADALKDAQRRGLVILGDPGSGKTTLLHFLALVFARGPAAVTEQLGITSDEADRLPIFAPLAAYDDMLNRDPDLTIREFLSQYYSQRRAMPGMQHLFDAAIDSGRALILLDGMDEVLEESRRKFVADQASAFIRALVHRGNRVLLTSRIYGYRVAPLSVELPHVTVLDFRYEEIEVFARQWNAAMAAWEYSNRSPQDARELARGQEKELLDEIKSNPGVERLAANPLLLSMLALLRRQVGRLPQQRIRLYTLYLGTLINAWEGSRSLGARPDAPVLPETGRAELVLIPLALWLQQNKPSGTATESELIGQIVEIFLHEDGLPPETAEDSREWREAAVRARQFLNDMRRFSGLLVERGQGVFGFRHLTFQEYYVGRALARMEATRRWSLLHSNLHANRWREPILLAAAQLGTIQADEDACTALVNNILDAKSPHEEILHRDLFLAADCAGDDINVRIATLRRIVDELKLLTLSPIPVVAAEVIRRLVTLSFLSSNGKPRLPETVEVLCGAVSGHDLFSLSIFQIIKFITPLLQLHSPLHEAVEAKLNDKNYGVQTAAIGALSGLLGEREELREAVRAKLNDKYSGVRMAAISALSGLLGENEELREVVEAKLNDEYYYVRVTAISALSDLLEANEELQKAVAAKLNDENYYVRVTAIGTLSGLVGENEELREAVAAKLNDSDNDVRVAAIGALSGLLGENKELREAVRAKLNDKNSSVRVAAIGALSGLLRENEELGEVVAAKLKDESPSVRAAVIGALSGLVRENEELRKAVVAKLNDENPSVRAAAIGALSKLSKNENSLLKLLLHPDWRTRRDIVPVLVEISVVFRQQVSEVMLDTRCLEARSARAAAIGALSGLLGEHEELRKAVVAKLNDEYYDVRVAAIGALSGLLGEHEELRKAVVATLNDEYYDVRMAAIRALSGLLGEHEELRKAVVATLNDEYYDVRAAAIGALSGLLGEHEELRKAVVATLNDSDNDVQVAAIGALSGLVGENVELREAIVAKLNDKNSSVRAAAIGTLSGLVGEHEELRKAVVAKLNNENYLVRVAAIGALSGLVGENVELREAIVAKLNDENYSVRAAAIGALSGLVGEHEELRKAVVAKLNDENYLVRVAAIGALRGLVREQEELREVVVAKLNDSDNDVRAAAIGALSGLVGEHEELRKAVVARLNDDEYLVRVAAIGALSGLVGENVELREAVVAKLNDDEYLVRAVAIQSLPGFIEDPSLRSQLSPILSSDDFYSSSLQIEIQKSLVKTWGQWARIDSRGRDEAMAMLNSPDFRLRSNGAEILMAGGNELVGFAVPQLLQMMDDHRGLDSWPSRIAAAEVLINHSPHSEKAIDQLVEALDYAVHPLFKVPMAEEIRTSAALGLGKLKAEEYRSETAEKLKEKLNTEQNPGVLDSLFSALLSLASAPA